MKLNVNMLREVHTFPCRCLLDAHEHVEPPVGLHFPAIVLTIGNLLQEVLLGLCLALLLLQRLTQVAYVFCGTQLRDAGQQHEGEEGDQQTGVGAQGEVGLGAGVLIRASGKDKIKGKDEAKHEDDTLLQTAHALKTELCVPV